MLFRSLTLASVAALAIACSGDTTDTTTTSDETDDETTTTPTVDSAPEEDPYFGARNFSLGAEIPFNGTSQYVAMDGGNEVPPIFYINIATPAWQTSNWTDTDNYCQFIFPMDNATFRTEISSDTRLWWAMNWDSKKDPVVNTCEQQGRLLNPDFWGKDVLQGAAGMLTSAHFAGIGDRTEAIDDLLTAEGKTVENAVGGVLSTPFQPFTVDGTNFTQIDDAWAFGFLIDENDELVRDGQGSLVDIERGDVFDGSSLAKGFYLVRANGWVWIEN